jgi:hypothetical protein
MVRESLACPIFQSPPRIRGKEGCRERRPLTASDTAFNDPFLSLEEMYTDPTKSISPPTKTWTNLQ